MIFTVSDMHPTSISLEAALQLPIRDAAVILELLPIGGMNIVVDDLVAEGATQHLRVPHQFGRLAERLRHFAERRVLIGVAGVRRLELQLLLDTGEPGSDERG